MYVCIPEEPLWRRCCVRSSLGLTEEAAALVLSPSIDEHLVDIVVLQTKLLVRLLQMRKEGVGLRVEKGKVGSLLLSDLILGAFDRLKNSHPNHVFGLDHSDPSGMRSAFPLATNPKTWLGWLFFNLSKAPKIRSLKSRDPTFPISTLNPTPSFLICRSLTSNFVCKTTISTKCSTMDGDKTSAAASSVNPKLERTQHLLHSGSSGGWDKCWEEGLTPWDLGKPTPVLVHLHQTGSLPKGRTLIPGCGSGYDVVAIACPERYVVGMDISDKAIERAKKLSAPLQNAVHFTFLREDFFTWKPSELFDLIFDYTFFCAIEPDMRSAWAIRVRDLLKPDGELITLMFPISDHVGGPPYKSRVSDYEEVLLPVGFEAQSIVENDLAIGPRKGREKLGRWKKIYAQPSL